MDNVKASVDTAFADLKMSGIGMTIAICGFSLGFGAFATIGGMHSIFGMCLMLFASLVVFVGEGGFIFHLFGRQPPKMIGYIEAYLNLSRKSYMYGILAVVGLYHNIMNRFTLFFVVWNACLLAYSVSVFHYNNVKRDAALNKGETDPLYPKAKDLSTPKSPVKSPVNKV